ncbi:MAG: glycosyltransferase family 39 protein [Terracidiphilus sp.]
MLTKSAGSTACSSFAAGWWTPRLACPVIAAAIARLAMLAFALFRNGAGSLSLSDTTSYLEPGRNLLLHGCYFADGVPDVSRTPGYSLFLAITSLAGPPAAALANVILSVFSVILVWRLGRKAFSDERIAIGAAWIFALEPLSITNSVVLLSDTLFLALFLLAMERLAVFLRERRLQALVAAGLWLAAATFVRPVTYYLPVALALGLFLVFARVPGLRWKAPAVLLISVLPWLAAWQMRNWIETRYTGFSSAAEVNLYFVAAATVTSRVEHRDFNAVRRESGYVDFANNSGQSYLFSPYLAKHPEQIGWSQGQRLAFMHSESLQVIRAHYRVYLISCLKSLLQPMFYLGAGYQFDRPMYPESPGRVAGFADASPSKWGKLISTADPSVVAQKVALTFVLLVLYIFAALGVRNIGMRNVCLWLLLATSLYFLAVTAAMGGLGGGARYRLPVMPAICILASAGFWRAKPIAQ